MTDQTSSARPADPSPSDYLGVLKRRGNLFFGIIALVVLVGVGIAFRLPPQYESKGVMLAEVPDVSDKAVRSTVTNFPEERVLIVTQRAFTKENLQKVIDDNHLYPELASTPVEARKAFWQHVALSAEDPEILESIMGTSKPAGSMAFSVSFMDPSPTVARDIANDLVELYLHENHEARPSRPRRRRSSSLPRCSASRRRSGSARCSSRSSRPRTPAPCRTLRTATCRCSTARAAISIP